MNRQVRRIRRRRLEPGINLIPMLDILLFLIFFFIVATNVKTDTGQLEINLPNSRTAAPPQPGETLPVVTIDALGRIGFQGRIVVEEELKLELKALAQKGTRRLRLRSDGIVPYQRVIEVTDSCREAGITTIDSEVTLSR